MPRHIPLAVSHDHAQCIDAALDKAADLCSRRGARLTKLRRRVLELVWQGHAAVKAYDLLGALDRGAGAAKPPTVYRALDFLIAHGLVHRLESLNAFVGCPAPEAPRTWSVWTHRWRPESTGTYTISLRCADPAVRTRRLDLFYYSRRVRIDEV